MEPQSDGEGKKEDSAALRHDVSEATALSGSFQSTCPTNILPATLKVSVGEVPMVICISHEICTGHKTHGPSSHRGGLRGPVALCGARFNL